jgi:hypothetical protein
MTSQHDEERMAEHERAKRKARAVVAKILLQLAEDERPTILGDYEPKEFRDRIAVEINAIDLLRGELLAWAREEQA